MKNSDERDSSVNTIIDEFWVRVARGVRYLQFASSVSLPQLPGGLNLGRIIFRHSLGV